MVDGAEGQVRTPYFQATGAQEFDGPGQALQREFVIGAAGDTQLASAIGDALRVRGGGSAIDATGKLSLLGSAALLSRVRALVTNDSAPLHLASAMNTPTIALFGPTIPAFGFGPLATTREIVQQESLPCRPCHAHGPQACPLGHWKCMRDTTAKLVSARLRQTLAQDRL